MKNIGRIVFAAAVAGLLIASSASSSSAVARPRYMSIRAFDGIWSVSIITYYGDCNRAYRYPLRIWDGQVLKADADPSYNVDGRVVRGGAIAVTISGNGQTASGTGRLFDSRGVGVWHTSNGECSGRWTAERRQ